MQIDDKLRKELFALVEYCKIYNINIDNFDSICETECPDLQSETLNIGVEVTNCVLEGEHNAIGLAAHTKKNYRESAFAYFVDAATDPNMLVNTIKKKTEKLNNHYKKFEINVLFIRVGSMFPGSNHFSNDNVKAFADVLSKTSFGCKLKFNPIILSELGDNSNDFMAFIVNTDDYSVTEFQGNRILTKEEIKIVNNWMPHEAKTQEVIP